MSQDKFYDQEYWSKGQHFTQEWPPALFRKVLEPILSCESVLDFGCGMGYVYQRQLATTIKRYVGADASAMAVEETRRKGLEAVRVDPDTGVLPLPNSALDSAVCIEVFEHLFDPLTAARELNRVLKPGGVLVATVPNFGYHTWRLLAFLRAQVPLEPPLDNRCKGVHIRFFSKLVLTRMLRDAGFAEIRVFSYDNANVWDIFQAMGHISIITRFARNYLPEFMYLRFLQDLWPNVFAMRLRVVARKPIRQ